MKDIWWSEAGWVKELKEAQHGWNKWTLVFKEDGMLSREII